jgi:hypothetical protein
MSVSVRATAQQGISTTINMPSGGTKAGDLIVIAAASGNANWGTVYVTGVNGGNIGTWSYYTSGTGNGNLFLVATALTGGTTSITISSTPNTTAGGISVALFSGVAPLSGSVTASYGPTYSPLSQSSVTTSSLTWKQGQLLLGLYEAFGWTTTTGSWGGTTETTAVQTSGSGRIALINYVVAPSSQTSTATSPTSASTQTMNSATFLILNAAVSGNMFLAMGM